MEKNIKIQIREINRLINYDRTKTVLEQESIFTQQMFNPNYGTFSKKDTAEKWVENIGNDLDSLSSFLCGDNSPFADWFTIPWLEYKSEELACDVLAGILMAFGPLGVVAGLGIEVAHARDLYNKGDVIGAWISLTIGLFPLIGDVAGKGLRVLLKKIGSSGITKVSRVFVMLIKFASGDIKASKLISAMTKLSPNEREMLYNLWSTSAELASKTQRLSAEFNSIKEKLKDLGYVGEVLNESIEKIIDILNTGGFFKGLGDFVAQTASIMTFVIGAQTVAALGHDPKDTSFETMEEILEYYKENPDKWLEIDLN